MAYMNIEGRLAVVAPLDTAITTAAFFSAADAIAGFIENVAVDLEEAPKPAILPTPQGISAPMSIVKAYNQNAIQAVFLPSG